MIETSWKFLQLSWFLLIIQQKSSTVMTVFMKSNSYWSFDGVCTVFSILTPNSQHVLFMDNLRTSHTKIIIPYLQMMALYAIISK